MTSIRRTITATGFPSYRLCGRY